MVGFIIIFSCAISGLVGLSAYLVPIASLALASVSAWEHRRLYRRARAIGATAVADETLVGSVINGLIAAGVAYAGGMIARLLLPI